MIKKLLQGPNRLWLAGCMAGCALMATTVTAQRPAARIRAEISDSQMSVLRGSQHPLAQGQIRGRTDVRGREAEWYEHRV